MRASRVSAEQVFRIIMILSIALVTLPLLGDGIVPLVDLPNHLARSYILANYENVEPFREWYARALEPVPNMAVDVVLVNLQRYLDPLQSARVFLLILLASFMASVHVLARALHGRTGFAAIIAMYFFYNSMLLYGFVNYVFGLAAFNVALAMWLRFRSDWSVPRQLMMLALALACFLVHLTSYLFLSIAITAITAWALYRREVRWPDAVRSLLPAASVGLVWLLLLRRQQDALSGIEWRLSSKLVGLLPFVRTYDLPIDLLAMALFLLGAVLLLQRRQDLVVHRPALVAAGALMVAFVLGPWSAVTGTAADQRFVPPAMLLALLAIRSEANTRSFLLPVGVVLFACVVRVGDVWVRWHQLGPAYREAMALAESVPRNARVYPLYGPPSGADSAKRDRALLHVAHLAVLSRGAILPNTLAIPGQQPLVYRSTPLFYKDPLPTGEIPNLDRFDVIWVRGPTAAQSAFLERCCVLKAQRGGFALWQIGTRGTS